MSMTLGDIIVNVKSDTSHLVKGFNRAESTITKTTKNMTNAVKTFAAAYIGLSAIDLASSLGKQADEMTNINSKLKLVTKSTEDLVNAQKELFKIAQETRKSSTGTVDLYTNLASSLNEMNKSQKEILKTTETVNKAIAISGGTIQQADAAIQQLGQAFASGKLAGDELKSILENSKGLAKAIADGMKVPIGALKELGAEGKITSEVLFNALVASADTVDEKFKNFALTISGAQTQLKNSTTAIIGQFDELTGASSFVANSIGDISKSIDEITPENIEETTRQIKIVALTIGAMAIAYKSASIATGIYSGIVARNTAVQAENIAMKEAEILAQTLGTRATHLRGLADKVIIDGMIGNTKATNFQIKALNKEAIASEIAALKQTKHAFSLRSTAAATASATVSTKALSFAMKAIPFVAIAGTIALIANSLFDATKASDELEESLSKTGKALSELTKNQLEYRKIVLDEALQDALMKRQKAVVDAAHQGFLESDKEHALDLKNKDEAIAKFREIREEVLKVDNAIKLLNSPVIDVSKSPESKKEDFSEFDTDLSDFEAGIEFQTAQNKAMFDYRIEREKELQELTISNIEDNASAMTSMLDAQISLTESGMNWSNSLSGVAGNLQDISKAIVKIDVGKMKFEKEDIKLQKDFAKSFLKADGDISKQKELGAKFDEDQAKLKETQLSAEMGGYASLAGAMVSSFEKGSAGAIAMTAVQSALGIASSWTAIAQAWASPFPSNIAAAAMVASQVMPIIGQLGGSSGGGGGVTQSQTPYENAAEKIEAQNKPILDRLDRQIELLESLNFKGTAGAVGVTLAGKTFASDIELLAQEALGEMTGAWRGYLHEDWFSSSQWTNLIAQAQENAFITSSSYGSVGSLVVNRDALQEDFIGFIQSLANTDLQSILSKQDGNIVYENLLNDIFELTNDYVSSMLGTVQEMEDASDTFKNIYDEISGTNRFEKERLAQAFSEFDEIRGEQGYAEYLESQIEAIDNLQESFNQDIISLFLDESVENIDQQLAALAELSKATGIAFENGVEDALNYIESIELVGDAIVESIEKQKEAIEDLESSAKSIRNTIDSLKAESLGDSFALDKFYKSMSETIALSKTEDFDAFNESIAETIGASSILKDASAFETDRDMRFAQLVAINQFESLEKSTLTQIDYLKQIAENTSYELLPTNMAIAPSSDIGNTISSVYDSAAVPDTAESEGSILGEIRKQNGILIQQNEILKESRDIENQSLVTLEKIEEAS